MEMLKNHKRSNKLGRYVVTGGPGVGKSLVFQELRRRGYNCSEGEIARDLYRDFKKKLGRHLEVGDRREYSRMVLGAFIKEYCNHKKGAYFYNRGIPDGAGWDRFFKLSVSDELNEAMHAYKYDGIFVLDPIANFEDETDVVWTSERDGQRVHQLIVQGYVDVGYDPIFVPMDFVENRVNFILSNL
ncbi:MAG: hypothetical protein DRP65_00855 [Planctomycetota bacterium]|nr:MAG: hypothetical protein DRP65_00855 [Planctomycetota bacterium]